MSKSKILGTLGISTLLFSSLPVFAHHAFSSEFDAKKPVTLTGTISKVDWSEPHAFIYLDVKNESGKLEQWKLETASPDFLKQHGIKESTLKKGEQLTVNGYSATSGSMLASARLVTTAGGQKLQVADSKEDGGPSK
jgi:hypothetical protein